MNIEVISESFINYCESSKNLSEHTLRAYKLDLKDFSNFIGKGSDITSCDRHLFRKYMGHLKIDRKLKATTIKRRIACIKVLFRWLEDEEIIEINPLYRLNERIILPKQLPRTLTRNEIGRLLLFCRKSINWQNSHTHTISASHLNKFTCLLAVEILFATGIRVGELASISKADIDLFTGIITINGKGNRQRLVFITDSEIIEMLTIYQELKIKRNYTSPLLLVNTRGGKASTSFIRKLITDAAEKANIRRRTTPHMLRHTTASHLLQAGVDIRYVQRLLGHHSISTTQIYTHVSDSQLKNIITNLHPRRQILADIGRTAG